jgi:hypothetical protein
MLETVFLLMLCDALSLDFREVSEKVGLGFKEAAAVVLRSCGIGGEMGGGMGICSEEFDHLMVSIPGWNMH